METKRELLSKLLDTQLEIVSSLHHGIARHNITEESPLSGDLINALLGVEALTNAIAALPLEEETQKRDRNGWVDINGQRNEQVEIVDKITQTYGSKALDRMGWQTSADKLRSNGEDEPMFIPDDDDAGW